MSNPKSPTVFIKNSFYGKPMWLALYLEEGKDIFIFKPDRQKSTTEKTLLKRLHNYIKTHNL